MRRKMMQIPDHLKLKRLRRGNHGSIEQDEFIDIVLAIIYLADEQQARRQFVIEKIHETYSAQFAQEDYELLLTQKPPKERWIHNVDWARRKSVEQGLLLPVSESPYGTWVLSTKGKASAKNIAKV
jgi:hypothetical protein